MYSVRDPQLPFVPLFARVRVVLLALAQLLSQLKAAPVSQARYYVAHEVAATAQVRSGGCRRRRGGGGGGVGGGEGVESVGMCESE